MSARQAPEERDDHLVDFSDYLRVLRRRRLLILTGVLLGALGGLFLGQHKPKTYTSAATVQVKPISSNAFASGLDEGNINIATQQQLASSTSVAQLVQKRLKTPQSPGQLLAGLVVRAPGKANALLFQYTAATPTGARTAAQAFADSYLAARASQANTLLGTLAQTYKDQLNSVQAQLTKVQGSLATAVKGTTAYDQATSLQSALQQQVNTLRGRLDDLATIVINPGSVIDAATLPGKPNGFGLTVYETGGALIGVILFVLLAFMRDRTDDRLHATEDLERELILPVLGVLPAHRRRRNLRQVVNRLTLDGRPPELDTPVPELQEAYGAMLARLYVAAREGHRLLMISSPLDDRDATATAGNLAVALARSDQRVALVLADNSEASSAWLLETLGLVSGMPHDNMPDGVARLHRQIPSLEVVVPRFGDVDTRRYVNPQRMHQLLQRLRSSHDYVIVAAAPVLLSADALVLATGVDATLLVVTPGRTRRRDIAEAVEQLAGVECHLLGVIARGGRLSRHRRSSLRKLHRDAKMTPPAIGADAEDETRVPARVLQSP